MDWGLLAFGYIGKREKGESLLFLGEFTTNEGSGSSRENKSLK